MSGRRRVDGVRWIFYNMLLLTLKFGPDVSCYRFLQREPGELILHPIFEKAVPPRLVSEHRTKLGRKRMELKAPLLVLGPVLALAGLGTISGDAAPFAAASADQEPRFGEDRGIQASLATVRADSTTHPFPVLP